MKKSRLKAWHGKCPSYRELAKALSREPVIVKPPTGPIDLGRGYVAEAATTVLSPSTIKRMRKEAGL